jgi:hypothetical protein
MDNNRLSIHSAHQSPPHTYSRRRMLESIVNATLANSGILLLPNCKSDYPTGPTVPACPGTSIIGDLGKKPEIHIVGLAAGALQVSGRVNNVNPQTANVVIWAFTNMWYVQPTIAEPYTKICEGGTWVSNTHPWIGIVALLTDRGYLPGSVKQYHPSRDPFVLAYDEYH